MQRLLSVRHLQWYLEFFSELSPFKQGSLRVHLLQSLNLGVSNSKLHGLNVLALLLIDWHARRRSNLLLLIHFDLLL
jgi:hypothetical protein